MTASTPIAWGAPPRLDRGVADVPGFAWPRGWPLWLLALSVSAVEWAGSQLLNLAFRPQGVVPVLALSGVLWRAVLLVQLPRGLHRWPRWPARAALVIGLALADTLGLMALRAQLDLLPHLDRVAIASLQLREDQVQAMFVSTSLLVDVLNYGALTLGLLLWREQWQRRHLAQLAASARLQQLQAQLHPHFLFNAMNSVRALIFENPQRAADMVTELSQLLRHSLEQDLSQPLPLAEDWALCHSYLALEGCRLEERLQLSVMLDAAPTGARLPPFTLLTLCENAVKHGISRLRTGGLLQVEALNPGEGHWRLRVSNPCPDEASDVAPGLRSGLRDLQERLRLMLGPAAGLTLHREPGHVLVELSLPLDAHATVDR